MEEGGTHTLDIVVIMISPHTYQCGEQLRLSNHFSLPLHSVPACVTPSCEVEVETVVAGL